MSHDSSPLLLVWRPFVWMPPNEGGARLVGRVAMIGLVVQIVLTVVGVFMTLAVGMVSPAQQSFSDIREITELAAEARRLDAAA